MGSAAAGSGSVPCLVGATQESWVFRAELGLIPPGGVGRPWRLSGESLGASLPQGPLLMSESLFVPARDGLWGGRPGRVLVQLGMSSFLATFPWGS